MHYEPYFYALAATVVAALIGGGLAGRTERIVTGLYACLILAAVLAALVVYLTRHMQTDGYVLLLAIATFMYSTVMAFSVSLVVRRLRHSRKAGSSRQP